MRIDDLHRAGYKLVQNPESFCFGIDAVLLSGFAACEKDGKIADLCAGNGIIPVLLCAKTEASHITGIEIQAESVELARESIRMNGLENRVEMIQCDIKDVFTVLKPASFDVVTANPPYMNAGGGLVNARSPKAVARHELLCSLEDVVSAAAKLLKTDGRLYMVHRPHRLADIIESLRRNKLEPKRMRLVHPYADKTPNLVLIEAVRGGNPMLFVEPPLIIYKERGVYTEEIIDIYYH